MFLVCHNREILIILFVCITEKVIEQVFLNIPEREEVAR